MYLTTSYQIRKLYNFEPKNEFKWWIWIYVKGKSYDFLWIIISTFFLYPLIDKRIDCQVTLANGMLRTRDLRPNLGLGLPPWNSPFHFGFLDLRQLVGLLVRVISSSQGLYLYTNTEKRTHTHTHTLNIHTLSGHDPGFRASEDSTNLRPLGYRDRRDLLIWSRNHRP
jgi:hypothetical protein